MLKVNNISFSYGEVPILTDVSIELNEGGFIAIFGPNGHGKSTLLKVITGLLSPSSGNVEYKGNIITRLEPKDIVNMGLVYIAEDRHLFPDMTVLENLKMGAYPKRARSDIKKNLSYVYDLFPKLRDMSNQRAVSLSGGEARMLAVGRGIMSSPKCLAIDEPSFGLAPILQQEVFKAIQEIQSNGTSILLVEQNTKIAYELADWIYVLEDGKIVFDGSTGEAGLDHHIRQVYLGV